MIRITAEKNPPMHTPNNLDKKNAEETAKKPALFLTITIPSNEEEVRCMSSTESNSPLSSSAHTSGGNSPQLRKMHRELSITKDFKRQQSLSEEPPILTSRTHRQDSKWNKVRRAFLTNSTFSVSLSPIRVASRQIFLQDGKLKILPFIIFYH
ncbi:uncharacterized protein LOC143185912 [Calliopsis andreniformis]|uniref:uncharacterized protein LOC143185912 n=1 Tax=Calliopsis andreniformis TaxID=337506 RepID=UPI003FCEC19A